MSGFLADFMRGTTHFRFDVVDQNKRGLLVKPIFKKVSKEEFECMPLKRKKRELF